MNTRKQLLTIMFLALLDSASGALRTGIKMAAPAGKPVLQNLYSGQLNAIQVPKINVPKGNLASSAIPQSPSIANAAVLPSKFSLSAQLLNMGNNAQESNNKFNLAAEEDEVKVFDFDDWWEDREKVGAIWDKSQEDDLKTQVFDHHRIYEETTPFTGKNPMLTNTARIVEEDAPGNDQSVMRVKNMLKDKGFFREPPTADDFRRNRLRKVTAKRNNAAIEP